jgi:thioredoxin-like negative regulator of GroEL
MKPGFAVLLAVFAAAACGRPPGKSAGAEKPAEAPPAAPAPQVASESDAGTRLELARALRNGGRMEEAEAEFRKVLASDPGSVEARLDLAQLLVWKKGLEEARGLLAGIGEAEGGARLRAIRADMAVAEGSLEEAAALLEKVVEENPEDDRSRFQWAQVLSWLKRYEASLKEYEILVERRPGDLQLRRHFAQVLGWAGQHERSAEEFRKTLP